MVHECIHCGYSTKFKQSFERHKNRKNPCHKIINDNIDNEEIGISSLDPKVAQEDPKVAQEDPKVAQEDPKVACYNNNDNYVKCDDCGKYFSNKKF
jgi:hypothetical protein